MFSLFDPARPSLVVDLFVAEPIRFDERWTQAVFIPVQGVSARVCSIPHLMALKELSGRSQDLLDLQNLKAILAARGGRL